MAGAPVGHQIWLTSFWGFEPATWGGIGFASAERRQTFLDNAPSGTIVAIYVTKQKGPKEQRGKLVGFLETTHEKADMQSLTSPEVWAQAQLEAASSKKSKTKWAFGVKASRAWSIIEEDWQPVERLLPETYGGHNKEHIGANGVPVELGEHSHLLALRVREVGVYKGGAIQSEWIGALADAVQQTKAVPLSKTPTLHKEADGPKRLYILQLKGDISQFLGRPATDLVDRLVIKVGVSVSPQDRGKQIMSAYPAKCAFRWEVMWQFPVEGDLAYPNYEVAVAGEDGMKQRLTEDREDGEWLGGEFYLAEEGLIERTKSAGKFKADQRMKELGLSFIPHAATDTTGCDPDFDGIEVVDVTNAAI